LQKAILKLPHGANCAAGGAQQLIHGATCARTAFRTDNQTKIRRSTHVSVCHWATVCLYVATIATQAQFKVQCFLADDAPKRCLNGSEYNHDF
jgi:hypothetical protein